MSNRNLTRAKKAKNDEFYTRIQDIEKELVHYRDQFRDKIIYCNCDDPKWSNFWKYFELNFEFFGLKKLISTHYDANKSTYKLELCRDVNGDGKINKYDIIKTPLKQNGDFRSDESIELLKEADIVVSNPPYSCFISYIQQLIDYNKKFIVLGPLTACGYKNIFPLIRDNKLWFGYGFNTTMTFEVPDNYEAKFIEDGKRMAKLGGITWYTNMPNSKRNEELILYKKYNSEEYPKYDNYDAINVDKVRDIPIDYDGVMGVPITFLGVYNPKQFKLVSFRKGTDGKDLVFSRERERESSTIQQSPYQKEINTTFSYPAYINGKKKFGRIFIKKLLTFSFQVVQKELD